MAKYTSKAKQIRIEKLIINILLNSLESEKEQLQLSVEVIFIQKVSVILTIFG